MEKAFNDVMSFTRKFSPHLIGSLPAMPDDEVRNLRVRLVAEEIAETLEAIDTDDLPGTADGIADSIYVLIGLAVSWGIDLPTVWDAVHAANMAKEGGPTRSDGKVLKPPGWQPPDIAGILERQNPIA